MGVHLVVYDDAAKSIGSEGKWHGGDRKVNRCFQKERRRLAGEVHLGLKKER